MTFRQNYKTTSCDNCKKDVLYFDFTNSDDSAEQKYYQVHNGLCLNLSGHYGGFTDDIEDSGRYRVTLCHDCCLAVARVLPNVFPQGKASHSMFHDESSTSCCEYAWDVKENDDQVYIGDGKGGWVPA